MNDNLHTYIEPELEARITALVLGEASEFEVDELERMIEEKPELARFRQRIKSMHGLLGDAVKPVADEDWQLSADRRAALINTFSRKVEPAAKPHSRSRGGNKWQAAIAIAACLVVCVVVFSMMTPMYKRGVEEDSSVAFTNYYTDGSMDGKFQEPSGRATLRNGSSTTSDGSRMVRLKTGLPKERIEGTPRSTKLPAVTPEPEKKANMALASLSKRRPSIPSSSMAKVIAANTTSPAAVPVPEVNAPGPSTDFGNGDDFGDGWGGGEGKGEDPFGGRGGGQLAKNERADRKAGKPEDIMNRLEDEEAGGTKPADETSEALISKNGGSKRDESVDKILPGGPGFAYDQKKAGKIKHGAPIKKDRSNMAADGEIIDDRQVAAGPGGGFKDKDANGMVWAADSDGGGTSAGISLDFDDDLGKDSADLGTDSNYWYKSQTSEGKRSKVVKGGFKRDLSNLAAREEDRFSMEQADAPVKPTKTDGLETSSIAQKEIARRKAQARPEEIDSEGDRVRKGLHMGEGLYNLGKYDEAEVEMKKVLQTDPQNKEARHMLEKVAATKSDYYKAGYDNTRAQLLTEVDKSWELRLPLANKPATKQTPKPIRSARLVDGLDLREMNKKIGKSAERVSGPQTKEKRLDEVRKDSKPTETTLARRDRPGRATMENGKKARPTLSIPSPLTPKALPDETTTSVTPFSTFSLNVADVSFKLAKVALLEKGQWPAAAKVRTEEFVNAFDYGDPSPRRGEPVACAIEQSAHPFLQQRNLLRVGMKTASIGRSAPLRLTILLDNSGSMEREDREASVLAAIQVLASKLGPQDVITVVGFARQPRLLADRISGDKAHKLVEIVSNTPSEGGTNIEEALRLARTLAKRQHTEGAQDRVVLITDGVANLGNTVPEELSKQIVAMRQEGIAFDACGVGADGLNDDILEALTRKGDGRYYFLNRAEDADSGFAKQLAGALAPAAKNVKVQVKFNPNRVSRYRLLGFEKHRLKKEDFRNDKVDAAEMAAEEAGNAVYQIQVNPQGSGELGEVFVRFLDVSTGRMVERSWPLPYEPQAPSFDLATPSMQLAGTAAMLGEKLHGTDAGSVRFPMISNTLNKLSGHFASDPKVKDLIRMCRKVK